MCIAFKGTACFTLDIKCKDVGLSINGNILDGISLCIAEDVDNGLVGGGSLCDGLWGTVIDDIFCNLRVCELEA